MPSGVGSKYVAPATRMVSRYIVERESSVELKPLRGVRVVGDRFDKRGHPRTFDLVTVGLVFGPFEDNLSIRLTTHTGYES